MERQDEWNTYGAFFKPSRVPAKVRREVVIDPSGRARVGDIVASFLFGEVRTLSSKNRAGRCWGGGTAQTN